MGVRQPLFTLTVGTTVGWADVQFSVAGKSVALSVSYLCEPLGDLVRLALLAATGANSGEVRLDGEGPEWQVEFATHRAPEKGKPGLMQLTVREFLGVGDPTGAILLRGDCVTRDFVADVLRQAVSVRDAYVVCWENNARPDAAIHALARAAEFLE